MNDKRLAVNSGLLTAAGLIMRLVGMLWQIWLVARIGEAGIGLFQLVMSVGALASTVAVSGSRYTSTRLVSEYLGQNALPGAAVALRSCLFYGTFFGLAAGLLLMLTAEPVGFLWLNDARTVRPLMLLALEMPLTGIDSVLHGYFTAVGRVWKSVSVSVLGQLVTIGLTAWLLTGCPGGNLELACVSIALGRLFGAVLELAAMLIIYALDRRRHGIRRSSDAPSLSAVTGHMLGIALPLAATAYARSGLSTLQHILVPIGLRASGLGAEDALAGYGVIQGMALPVVLFPSCVILAVAEMIVPKLTEQQMQGDEKGIAHTVRDLLRYGWLFAALTASLLFTLGDGLGETLYHSPAAGKYIRLFALIVPVMYLDMAADGCLKGLGEMQFCMYVNIADAGLSALMVWLLLPRFGLSAYIFTICFTESFNFLLSYGRLRRLVKMQLGRQHLYIGLWAAVSGLCSWLLYNTISAGNGVPALILSGLCGIALYTLGITSGAGAGRRASG